MDDKTLAVTLYRLAREDLNPDNIGRLILTEVASQLDTPPRAEQVITLFRTFYSGVTVEQRTSNILLVYFDGKQDTQNRRSINVIIPPPATVQAQPSDAPPAETEERNPEDYYSDEDPIW